MRNKRWLSATLAATLLCACLALAGCQAPPGGEVSVLLDGKPLQGVQASRPDSDGLTVYITLDGAPLAELPFGEAHTVTVRQPDGGENVVRITETAVFMESANCENQDCVEMGEVTRENLELRVMGGFIVCLPHRLSVEVRGE